MLTRDSAVAYLSTVTVAPITSTIHGVPSEVVLSEDDGMKRSCAVNLHNAITVSQERLGKRVARFELAANERNLRRAAVLCGLRCPSGVVEAASKPHPRRHAKARC